MEYIPKVKFPPFFFFFFFGGGGGVKLLELGELELHVPEVGCLMFYQMCFCDFVSCISLKSNRLWMAGGMSGEGSGELVLLIGHHHRSSPCIPATDHSAVFLWFCQLYFSKITITHHSAFLLLTPSQLEYYLIRDFRKQRQIEFCFDNNFPLSLLGCSWLVKK